MADISAHSAPDFLQKLMHAAIDAADPAKGLARYLPEKPKGRCIVIGAGKSAAAMARAVEQAWPDVALSGTVVTRYEHAVETQHIEVLEAAHPVPDDAGFAAAQKILQVAQSAGPEDLVLALISGGGSALMPAPVPPMTLEDEVTLNKLLLRSGLAIGEMNCMRRRVSLIKGGGLAAAVAPAELVTLAISDVPGDDPAAIASGPTVPDPTAGMDLSELVSALGPDLPSALREVLSKPAEPMAEFTPDYRMIASPLMALEAAAKVAQSAGITPMILGDAIEGEAREAGVVMAGIAKSLAAHGHPIAAPAVLLSGGETTVTIGPEGAGKGGRNTEFLLSMGIALEGAAGIYALAADTDGIDGSDDAAGAWIGPDMDERAAGQGLSPAQYLAAHDSYSLFEGIGTLLKTGPTLTNVNDFRAVLVLPQG